MVPAHHHIENFNRLILELFIRLHDAFPHPQNLDLYSILSMGPGETLNESTDGEGAGIGMLVNDIMEWLSEEGFIRYDPDPNYRPGTFWKVRLTLKSVTVLGYIPVSFRKTDPKEPLIQKAKHVIPSTGSSSGREAIKKVVEEIFKLSLSLGLSPPVP